MRAYALGPGFAVRPRCSTSLGPASAIFLAIRSAGGLLPALAAITVLADVLAYAGYFFVLRRIQQPFQLSPGLATRTTFREILGYSAFTFVAKVGDQLRFYVDALVIGAFVTVNAVTHYAVASRLAICFLERMVAIFGLLVPWSVSCRARTTTPR